MRIARFVAFGSISVLAACGGSDTTSGDTTAASAAPSSSGAVAADQAAGAATSPDQSPRSYQLTMPAVQRWYAAQRAVYQAVGRNPELGSELEVAGGTTVDAFEAHYDGVPEFREAIEGAGMEVREYATILIVLSAARNAQADAGSGTARDAVAARWGIAPENVDFYAQNRAAIERMDRELAQMAGG